ncbi:MAG: glycosyltransferase family 4 protein [Pantoea sp. Morm]|uniref:glycosyltransferase family 4 protein n=1 Tax=Pantoea sp. Morm TaxID=2601250 RepID=UPI001D756ECF|nr:glycosyltransferase family 4 protein [Pantoea sp. Morm]
MQKVCYFINSDWYFDLHWKERALAALSEGYEVHIVCNFESTSIRNELNGMGFITHNSNMAEQSLGICRSLLDSYKAFRILLNINPHLIHCITIKSCLIGGIYAKFFNKALVLSFVGLGRVFSHNSKKYKFLRFFVKKCYSWIVAKKNVFLIFEHENDRKVIIGLTNVDSAKTEVIDGAGVNINEFKFELEKQGSRSSVLYASRLIWSKGLGDLVEVKKILLKRGVDFELKVAGIVVKDDPDSIPIETIQQWHEQCLITWLGRSYDVNSLIQNSSLIALPSTYAEGVPRILIEASAVGRPSIAYDNGGCSSIIKHAITGYLVEKKNLEDLTQKIECLLKNYELRKTFGLRARALVIANFSSDNVINRTLSIYKNLN